MESHAKNVFEQDQQQAVGSIQNHADKKRPFLASARELPEENENTGDDAIDNQVQHDSRGADRMRDRIDNLRDAESDNEMKIPARQSDDGINEG